VKVREPGTQKGGSTFVALVSKSNIGDDEVGFSLQFRAICTGTHAPEACLGTIGRAFRLNGQRTNTFNKLTLSCGSKQDKLNDHILNFQVGESGLYRISLFDVRNGNSTLQINDAGNDQVLGCDAGNTQEPGGSAVEAFL
jgi:hypothetical protein